MSRIKDKGLRKDLEVPEPGWGYNNEFVYDEELDARNEIVLLQAHGERYEHILVTVLEKEADPLNDDMCI